ncbi:hypothetical protein EDB80DRAFT_135904 [Ilyonectria destructans]|nr:hypothetical protein EDB80DRAFT_135904 [Ilyonectria destructans]
MGANRRETVKIVHGILSCVSSPRLRAICRMTLSRGQYFLLDSIFFLSVAATGRLMYRNVALPEPGIALTLVVSVLSAMGLIVAIISKTSTTVIRRLNDVVKFISEDYFDYPLKSTGIAKECPNSTGNKSNQFLKHEFRYG